MKCCGCRIESISIDSPSELSSFFKSLCVPAKLVSFLYSAFYRLANLIPAPKNDKYDSSLKHHHKKISQSTPNFRIIDFLFVDSFARNLRSYSQRKQKENIPIALT